MYIYVFLYLNIASEHFMFKYQVGYGLHTAARSAQMGDGFSDFRNLGSHAYLCLKPTSGTLKQLHGSFYYLIDVRPLICGASQQGPTAWAGLIPSLAPIRF